jgi:dihydrofolate reductase
MRRFVNVTHVSLDGVMERMEDWHFEYADDELDQVVWETLSPCDALVLGRRTYEGFAEAWPGRGGRIADKLNGMDKYLASTTITDPAWEKTSVLGADLGESLAKLKEGPGGDVMSYGFGPVARTMLQNGLLDELHIGINPVFAGKGKVDEMLIQQGAQERLALIGTRVLGSGVVMLTYRRQ